MLKVSDREGEKKLLTVPELGPPPLFLRANEKVGVLGCFPPLWHSKDQCCGSGPFFLYPDPRIRFKKSGSGSGGLKKTGSGSGSYLDTYAFDVE